MAERKSERGHKTVTIIDFEACSLGSASYPIEVGVALAPRADQPLHVWSTLTSPHSSWSPGVWDVRAERIHGIAQSTLENGLSATATMLKLNALLGPLGTVYCDGGDFDRFWFERLCRAAPLITPEFQLHDVSKLFVGDQRALSCMNEALDRSPPPHRAGPDAARLCQATYDALASSSLSLLAT